MKVKRSLEIMSLAVIVCLPFLAPAPVAAQPMPLGQATEFGVAFRGKKNAAAVDMSGIACEQPQARPRRCVVVNDENRFAQEANLTEGSLLPGAIIGLIGRDPPEASIGAVPSFQCRAQGDYGEFDGEAVAFDGRFFYVAGSHGCARRSGEFRLSSFHLARVDLNAEGGPRVELSYRLANALSEVDELKDYAGLDLNTANGLNIEGFAVVDGRAYAGLRAPVLGGRAFLIRTDVERLFAPNPSQPLAAQAIPLMLGEAVGVRDLAPMPDGRLLVLAGPATEQSIPYRLVAFDPQSRALEELGELPAVLAATGEPAKAEAAMVMDSSPGELRVLILFDGLVNGGPRVFSVPVPAR